MASEISAFSWDSCASSALTRTATRERLNWRKKGPAVLMARKPAAKTIKLSSVFSSKPGSTLNIHMGIVSAKAAGRPVRQSEKNFHTGPWFSTWSGLTFTPRYLKGPSGRSDHSFQSLSATVKPRLA